MQFIPIKTKILQPPHDDLLIALTEAAAPIHNGDVLIVSSKVVAIHEGRCMLKEGVDKTALVAAEADVLIPTEYRPFPLTVTRHTFLSAAGIDDSNGNGYYVLLPQDCFASAERLYRWAIETYQVDQLGVIIVDSRSLPFRYGATGVALGWWGIAPLRSHIGTPDLFGRPFAYERSNIVDGLAAGATVVMGETNESTPLVVARGVPQLTFTTADTRAELLAPYVDDTFRILYERWLP
jgi:F420-0:gamma-glutamyl ligase